MLCGHIVNPYINNKLLWLWNIAFSYLWVNSGDVPESNTKDRYTGTRQYSPNTERALTLDKPRGVQSADHTASSLHGRLPESSSVPPGGKLGALGRFQSRHGPQIPQMCHPSENLGTLPLFKRLLMSKYTQNAAWSRLAPNPLKRGDPLRSQNGYFWYNININYQNGNNMHPHVSVAILSNKPIHENTSMITDKGY